MRTCTDPASTTSLLNSTVAASATRPSFPLKPGKLLINGEWRDAASGKTFDVIDPTTEEVVAQVAEGTSIGCCFSDRGCPHSV